jgi:hypothetical protein
MQPISSGALPQRRRRNSQWHVIILVSLLSLPQRRCAFNIDARKLMLIKSASRRGFVCLIVSGEMMQEELAWVLKAETGRDRVEFVSRDG